MDTDLYEERARLLRTKTPIGKNMERFDEVMRNNESGKYQEIYCLDHMKAVRLESLPSFSMYKLVVPLDWDSYDSKYHMTLLIPKDELLASAILFEKKPANIFSLATIDERCPRKSIARVTSLLNRQENVDRYIMYLSNVGTKRMHIINTLTLSVNDGDKIKVNPEVVTVWKYYCDIDKREKEAVDGLTFAVGIFINIVQVRELLSRGKLVPGEAAMVPLIYDRYKDLCWDIQFASYMNTEDQNPKNANPMRQGAKPRCPTRPLLASWNKTREMDSFDDRMRDIVATELYAYQKDAVIWMNWMERNVFNRKIIIPSLADIEILCNSNRGKVDADWICDKITGDSRGKTWSASDPLKNSDIYATRVGSRFVYGKKEETLILQGGLLCDEMGLGKSLIVYALIHMKNSPLDAEMEKLNPLEKTANDVVLPFVSIATLIIVPGHICRQWKSQFNMHFSQEYKTEPSNKVIVITSSGQLDEYEDSITMPCRAFQYRDDTETKTPMAEEKEEEKGDEKNKKKKKKKITYEKLCSTKVVIISSEALAKNILQYDEQDRRTKKRIELNQIMWERVVLDEGHEILEEKDKRTFTGVKDKSSDSDFKKRNTVLKRSSLNTIHSKYKWYVTGTPQQESDGCISLRRISKFLGFTASTHDELISTDNDGESYVTLFQQHFSDNVWSNLQKGAIHPKSTVMIAKALSDTISKWLRGFIFWRNTKENVNLTHILPEKEEVTVVLDFSTMERKIYDDLNNSTFPSIDMLRKMCSHPQVCDIYKNRNGSEKKILKMEELRAMIIDQNVEKMATLEQSLATIAVEIADLEQLISECKREHEKTLKDRSEKTTAITSIVEEIKRLDTAYCADELTDNDYDEKHTALQEKKKTPEWEVMHLDMYVASMGDNLQDFEDNLRLVRGSQREDEDELKTITSRQNYFKDVVPILNGTKKADCSICTDEIVKSISLGKCLHYFCTLCIREWLKTGTACPICREFLSISTMMDMKIKQESIPTEETMDQLKELYGTKMAYIINHIKNVIPLKEPSAKVLVFSQWDEMLELVSATLSDNDIDSVIVKGTTNERLASVKKFQNDEKCKVILLSTTNCASGTNLVRANWIFLIDPILGGPEKANAIESQAIARSFRQGQKNNVHVFRLIISNTIEEDIIELFGKWKELSAIAQDVKFSPSHINKTGKRPVGITDDGEFDTNAYMVGKIRKRRALCESSSNISSSNADSIRNLSIYNHPNSSNVLSGQVTSFVIDNMMCRRNTVDAYAVTRNNENYPYSFTLVSDNRNYTSIPQYDVPEEIDSDDSFQSKESTSSETTSSSHSDEIVDSDEDSDKNKKRKKKQVLKNDKKAKK